jgi:methionyl-tRNA formyltransferase
MVYHALAARFSGLQVILEEKVSRLQLARRRMKKLGPITVMGQMLFVSVVVPFLKKSGRRRIEVIKKKYKLDDSPICSEVIRVPSVNSPAARDALRRLKPAVVVVNGTRIIGRETLRAVTAPFINTHAGITPHYRGAHGGYWALADGRPDLAGSTVHLVDEGIDTGAIIRQATFAVGPEDSFATYPYLHVGVAIPILIDAVEQVLGNRLELRGVRPNLPSKLHHHPTLWGYFKGRMLSRVR